MGRKTARDGGRTAKGIASQIEATEKALIASDTVGAKSLAINLEKARKAFLDVVDFVVTQSKQAPNEVFAGSVPYLMLAGNLVAGWQMGRALLAAQEQITAGNSDKAFMEAKVTTARFYGEHILVKTLALRDEIVHGGASVMALPLDSF